MKWRRTGSTSSGASMSLFLKNQDCPKTPLCNTDTYTDVNGSTAEAEELYSDFKTEKYLMIFKIF